MAFKLISAEELFYQPLDPAKAEMIIEDMIPQGLTLIAGAPKSGKSWMMLDMCLAVSSGRSFLGRKTLRCEVAYFPLEDQEERVKKRMLDLGEAVDEKEMQPNMLNAKISKFYYTVFYTAGITMTQKRTVSERLMTLTYQPEPENNAPVEEPQETWDESVAKAKQILAKGGDRT